ncbi:MAG: hypothetical protein AAF353_15455 [Pseudomonadota bacterium]
MPRIVLNGLHPGSGKDPRINIKDALVAIYLSRKYNTPEAELLFEASPDSNGTIDREISDEYIGEKITIVLCDLKFEFINIEKMVDELGVYYTFNLKKDYCYNGREVERSELDSINTEEMNNSAQDSMREHIRNSKYDNKFIRYGSMLLAFGAPLVGLTVAALPGVFIGIAVSTLLYFYTPFITGAKKW